MKRTISAAALTLVALAALGCCTDTGCGSCFCAETSASKRVKAQAAAAPKLVSCSDWMCMYEEADGRLVFAAKAKVRQ